MTSKRDCLENAKPRNKKGDGSIRKTKYGTYEYRITYTDTYGQRKRRGFTCQTPEECFDRAEDFLEELRIKMGGMTADMTLSDILRQKAKTDFEKNYTGEQGYDRTLKTINLFDKYGVGKMRMNMIKPKQIEVFLGSITHYSNGVIGKVYGLLRTAFKRAYEAGVIEYNYMLLPEFRCPKSTKPTKKVRGLTEAEQTALLEVLEKHKVPYGANDYRLQLLIELYSGMRMGEINALRPENIHLDKGYIHVDATISRGMDSRSFIKEGTKTYAGNRDVPISKTLRPILEKALYQMKENPLGLVFYDYQKGDVIHTNQVNNFFNRMMKRAGIRITGQHSLRHTFATRCIEAGIQPIVLKTWLGHTNIHITLDTYADVFNRMNFDATEKFDELMGALDVDEDDEE